MNLKNKQSGRIVQVPPAEPEVYVSVVNGRIRVREDGRGPLLTEEDIIHRAEEARRSYAEEVDRSMMWTALWFLVGLAVTIGAGAWVVQFMREAFKR